MIFLVSLIDSIMPSTLAPPIRGLPKRVKLLLPTRGTFSKTIWIVKGILVYWWRGFFCGQASGWSLPWLCIGIHRLRRQRSAFEGVEETRCPKQDYAPRTWPTEAQQDFSGWGTIYSSFFSNLYFSYSTFFFPFQWFFPAINHGIVEEFFLMLLD